ncbi:hypothetical protein EGR_11176 [Echinococcus granulosus]|uniref:Uncharacterized protein n=1 Tax=Echinococcus granulosus TaxID=6210 RepID=W6U6L7_ECHGR|nr:hypothetical protein EGR_11176 [Echinococcus granulosus]EUB53967.1 hypothetical protein EGR_11176 [Echinococcus granulosus]
MDGERMCEKPRLDSGPDHGSSGSRDYGYACRTTRHDRRRSDNGETALP